MDFRFILIFAIVGVHGITGFDPLCDDELIKGLPDSQLSASSSLTDPTLITDPTRARLNTVENTLNNGTTYMGAWAPSVDGGGQYVQAMFPEMTMVTGIQTQGRNQGTNHVTLYKIEYTLDGNTWETVNNDVGVEQIFMGNTDGDTVQDNPLDCALFAKGIRIVPLEWNPKTALRFELNGCYVDNAVIITTPSVSTMMTTMVTSNSSTFLPGIVTPFGPTTPAATLLTTPTQPLSTTNPSSTVNLLTLIHWFITHISNTTTPGTTPITTMTTMPTTTKTTTKPTTTTTTTTRKPTTTTTTTTTTTPSTTTTTTTRMTTTTTPYAFHPGIINPFGTTRRGFQPGSLIG